MRTGTLVLSAGRSRSRRRRKKSPAQDPQDPQDPQVPVLLLRDMKLCYRLLRQLVPGLPPGRAASRVEILQHVIDYILDLQTELDGSCPSADPGGTQRVQVAADAVARVQDEFVPRPWTSVLSAGLNFDFVCLSQCSNVPCEEFDIEDGWTPPH